MTAKIDDAMPIIRDLAEMNPMIAGDGSWLRCMTCELESAPGHRVREEEHGEQCAWRRARALVDKEYDDDEIDEPT